MWVLFRRMRLFACTAWPFISAQKGFWLSGTSAVRKLCWGRRLRIAGLPLLPPVSVHQNPEIWARSFSLPVVFGVWSVFVQHYLWQQQWTNGRANQNNAHEWMFIYWIGIGWHPLAFRWLVIQANNKEESDLNSQPALLGLFLFVCLLLFLTSFLFLKAHDRTECPETKREHCHVVLRRALDVNHPGLDIWMGFEILIVFSFFFHWSGGIMFLSPGRSVHQGSPQRDFRSTKLPVKLWGLHLASSFIPHDFLKPFTLLVL